MKRGRLMVVEFTNAAEQFGIVAVIKSSAAGNDDEVIPKQTAALRHFHGDGIKFFARSAFVACRQVRPLFAGKFRPRVK